MSKICVVSNPLLCEGGGVKHDTYSLYPFSSLGYYIACLSVFCLAAATNAGGFGVYAAHVGHSLVVIDISP